VVAAPSILSKDQLVDKVGDLFGELVALDILEVRAKG